MVISGRHTLGTMGDVNIAIYACTWRVPILMPRRVSNKYIHCRKKLERWLLNNFTVFIWRKINFAPLLVESECVGGRTCTINKTYLKAKSIIIKHYRLIVTHTYVSVFFCVLYICCLLKLCLPGMNKLCLNQSKISTDPEAVKKSRSSHNAPPEVTWIHHFLHRLEGRRRWHVHQQWGQLAGVGGCHQQTEDAPTGHQGAPNSAVLHQLTRHNWKQFSQLEEGKTNFPHFPLQA